MRENRIVRVGIIKKKIVIKKSEKKEEKRKEINERIEKIVEEEDMCGVNVMCLKEEWK